MATPRSADREPNITECAVCHDSFTVPKILPCGHHLCRDCLVTWLQSQPQAACPLCRCVIVDPTKQGGRSVDEVADDLPTDLAMTAMVEAETLLSKQHVCCVCDDVAAVALCLKCGDMLCRPCRDAHKKLSATKKHEVEELSSLTTERLAAHHPATCPDHEEKVSKVHCPTHSTSVCLLCATTKHRDCEKLVSLHSQVGELTAELADISVKLTKGAAKADSWLYLLDRHVEQLQTESQIALDEMKNVCDRLKAAIDARFSFVREKTLTFVSDLTVKANEVKQSIIQQRSMIAAHITLTDLYKKFTEHKYFKDMINVVQGRLPDLDMVNNLPEDLLMNQKLILAIDPKAVTDGQRILSALGDITMAPENKDERKTQPALKTAQTSRYNYTSTSLKLRPSGTQSKPSALSGCGRPQSLSRMTKINPMTAAPSSGVVLETRSQEDKESPGITCIITGPSCEELYMADAFNKSIKVFSLKTNSVVSSLTLDVQPWAIALVKENQLVMTSFHSKIITLIDITVISNPHVKYKIDTTRYYQGISVYIAVNDEVTLIVSCEDDDKDPASVDMITMTGTLIRTIVTSQNLPDLQRPWYLHADTRRGVLYISDYGSNCVFCVQLSTGRLLPQLEHPQLSGPHQVCTDSEDNLYVASYEDECILVKSASDQWRVLLSDKELAPEKHPVGICLTQSGLVVSHFFDFATPGAVNIYNMTESVSI